MQRLTTLFPQLGRSPESSASALSTSQSPTLSPVSPGLPPSDHQRLREERPGYFPDIGTFLQCSNPTNDNLNFEPTWTSGRQAIVAPRTIIYIKDTSTSTRLNDRVMLVLRKTIDTGFTLTCLSFCKHTDLRIERLNKTHRRVKASGPPPRTGAAPVRAQGPIVNNARDAATRLRSVEVDLFHSRDLALSPQPEVTLNCEELWNVEREVAVAVLGEVTPASFKDVVDHVKQLFCDALDQAVNEDAGPPTTHPAGTALSPAIPIPVNAIIQPNRRRYDDRHSGRDERATDRQAERHDEPRRRPSGDPRRDSHSDRPRPRYRVESDWRGNQRVVEL